MPIPISPNSYTDNMGQGMWHNIDVSSLLNNRHTIQDSILPNSQQRALSKLASDEDADLLLDVWNKSSIIANGSNIEDKTYKITDVDSMSINRLKNAGLITGAGDGTRIKFTGRAASVIKTIVLSETNQFLKRSVKKPYSLIMAENNNSKKKINLALANKFASTNIPIPGKSAPRQDQPCIANTRLVKINNHSEKEYTVRIYVGDNLNYEIWGFNGRLNGRQIPQPKGVYSTIQSASHNANIFIREKENKGYVSAGSMRLPLYNETLPGSLDFYGDMYSDEEESDEQQDIAKRKLPTIDGDSATEAIDKYANTVINDLKDLFGRMNHVSLNDDFIKHITNPNLTTSQIQEIANIVKSNKQKVVQGYAEFERAMALHPNAPSKWTTDFIIKNIDLFGLPTVGWTIDMIEKIQSTSDLEKIISAVVANPTYRTKIGKQTILTEIACHPQAPVDWAVNFFFKNKDIFKEHRREIQNTEVEDKAEDMLMTGGVKIDTDEVMKMFL
jgi:hypothetical protein